MVAVLHGRRPLELLVRALRSVLLGLLAVLLVLLPQLLPVVLRGRTLLLERLPRRRRQSSRVPPTGWRGTPARGCGRSAGADRLRTPPRRRRCVARPATGHPAGGVARRPEWRLAPDTRRRLAPGPRRRPAAAGTPAPGDAERRRLAPRAAPAAAAGTPRPAAAAAGTPPRAAAAGTPRRAAAAGTAARSTRRRRRRRFRLPRRRPTATPADGATPREPRVSCSRAGRSCRRTRTRCSGRT